MTLPKTDLDSSAGSALAQPVALDSGEYRWFAAYCSTRTAA